MILKVGYFYRGNIMVRVSLYILEFFKYVLIIYRGMWGELRIRLESCFNIFIFGV